MNELKNRVAPDETANILTAAGGELRNMLSVLKMAADLLLPAVENLGGERYKRYAAMIYHCYYGMLRLAGNCADFGAATRGDMPVSFASYDIISDIRELVWSVDHLVGGGRVRFESNEETLIIYADRDRLDRMLLNLISNSLQNAPRNGLVTVSAVSAAGRVVISVSDDGPGISGEVLQTAWGRYRAAGARAGASGGAGLGLSIVQSIARRHGGSAVLESRPGGGTTVTVSLPVLAPEAADLRGEDQDNGGMHQLLTELSGVIGYDKYTQLYMD